MKDQLTISAKEYLILKNILSRIDYIKNNYPYKNIVIYHKYIEKTFQSILIKDIKIILKKAKALGYIYSFRLDKRSKNKVPRRITLFLSDNKE